MQGALAELRTQPERQPKLEAVCLEGMGDLRGAAQCHVADGNLKEALLCNRNIPDLDEALKLIGKIGDHPAAESLEWIAKVQRLVAERPENFTKTVTVAEKKLLQELLEKALGVNRPKATPRRGAKKSTVPRRRVPGKIRGDGNSPFRSVASTSDHGCAINEKPMLRSRLTQESSTTEKPVAPAALDRR